MSHTRKYRLLLTSALIIAASLATLLIILSLQYNITYLYTPSEVHNGDTSQQAKFRLGGMVTENSLLRVPGSMQVHFVVTDGNSTLPVVYTGILPDLFREKQAVIATGTMRGNTFAAEKILAKHDETYMPKEVADKMGIAHRRHDVQPPQSMRP